MLPSSGPRQRDILLHLRNFSGLAQVTKLELGGIARTLSPSREQLGAGRRECDEGPGLVHLEPAALDREFNSRAVLGRT
jgi:hypothetical protein